MNPTDAVVVDDVVEVVVVVVVEVVVEVLVCELVAPGVVEASQMASWLKEHSRTVIWPGAQVVHP